MIIVNLDLRKKQILKIKENLLEKGRSEKSSIEMEKKDYSFKGKKKFFKKKQTKLAGFTNNPKYLEKKHFRKSFIRYRKKKI